MWCAECALFAQEHAISFPELLRRFPHIELAGTPERRDSLAVRGFTRLPVHTETRRCEFHGGRTRNGTDGRLDHPAGAVYPTRLTTVPTSFGQSEPNCELPLALPRR